MRTLLSSATVAAALLLAAPSLSSPLAPAVAEDTDRPIAMRTDTKVSAVTLYQGRAAVTRSGVQKLDQGIYELRIGSARGSRPR
ncbi:MAG: hypothetical protein ACKOYN_10290 [Planctomycetota bacterium]